MMNITEIQSEDHKNLLDIIDRLRARGISQYVNLPEIIVCGDQSAGKSSVLEAISGISFPTKDNLCTRFATELVLRRHETSGAHASIIPNPDRPQNEKDHLSRFHRAINLDTLNLGDVIEAAKESMGLSDTKVFSSDTLRVELYGPDQPHLTLVDLPGLFRAGNKDQSMEDASTVREMVHSYMKSPRSIILAVVSAKNDFALQEVTELARKLDSKGQRTLGLITKPDTLDQGSDSEASYLKLASNQDVTFRLGWHVLRNRSYEMRDASTAERNKAEADFFAQRSWKNLDPSQVGIASLKPKLSRVLRDQILQQLPGLLHDVESEISNCKSRLNCLGGSRLNVEQQRLYLLRVSQQFSTLMKSAVDGVYSNPFFGSTKTKDGYSKRLRAIIQNLLTSFEKQIRLEGQTRTIIETPSKDYEETASEISRSDYVNEVKDLMRKNRGRELPGTFNPLIIAELFTEQCQPWKDLVNETNNAIFVAVFYTTRLVIEHIAIEETVENIYKIIKIGIENLKTSVDQKLEELLDPHYLVHPITYNHYLTDNVQNAQASRRRRTIEATLKKIFAIDSLNENCSRSVVVINLLNALDKSLEVDMQRYGSDLAVDYMQSYYKVALKRLVDDISVLAIEERLVQKLPSLFSPELIFDLKDEEVVDLAAESEKFAAERSQHAEKLRILEACWRDLRHLDKYCSSELSMRTI